MPSIILMFGETLSRFEVSTSRKTLFNHRAGSTPQDTIASIITRRKVSKDLVEYFTYSDTVKSKLKFNLVGKYIAFLETSLNYFFLFAVIHMKYT